MRYDAAGASFGGTNVLKMAVTSAPGGEQQLESASGLQTTNWQHVAMTWKGGDRLHFYADGKPITPTRPRRGERRDHLRVHHADRGMGGKDLSGNPGTGWNGLIDDVRIYSTVLTAAQIAEFATNKPISYKASEPNPADKAHRGRDSSAAVEEGRHRGFPQRLCRHDGRPDGSQPRGQESTLYPVLSRGRG